jgi:hypothetical protein
MLIIGCDYHPGFQQVAFVDAETGERGERRLMHREEAEQFSPCDLVPHRERCHWEGPIFLNGRSRQQSNANLASVEVYVPVSSTLK